MNTDPNKIRHYTIFPSFPDGVSLFSYYISQKLISGYPLGWDLDKHLFHSIQFCFLSARFSPTKLAWELNDSNIGDFLERTTLFKFYFSTLSDCHKKEWMKELSIGKIQKSTFCQKYIGQQLHKFDLHFCLQCVHEDESNVGISCWHLSHQIPGIHHCPKHYTKLACLCPRCKQPQASLTHWNTPSSACPFCNAQFRQEHRPPSSKAYFNYVRLCNLAMLGEFNELSPSQRNRFYERELMKYGDISDEFSLDNFISTLLRSWELPSLEVLSNQIETPISKEIIKWAMRGHDIVLNPTIHLAIFAALLPENKFYPDARECKGTHFNCSTNPCLSCGTTTMFKINHLEFY